MSGQKLLSRRSAISAMEVSSMIIPTSHPSASATSLNLPPVLYLPLAPGTSNTSIASSMPPKIHHLLGTSTRIDARKWIDSRAQLISLHLCVPSLSIRLPLWLSHSSSFPPSSILNRFYELSTRLTRFIVSATVRI